MQTLLLAIAASTPHSLPVLIQLHAWSVTPFHIILLSLQTVSRIRILIMQDSAWISIFVVRGIRVLGAIHTFLLRGFQIQICLQINLDLFSKFDLNLK